MKLVQPPATEAGALPPFDWSRGLIVCVGARWSADRYWYPLIKVALALKAPDHGIGIFREISPAERRWGIVGLGSSSGKHMLTAKGADEFASRLSTPEARSYRAFYRKKILGLDRDRG